MLTRTEILRDLIDHLTGVDGVTVVAPYSGRNMYGAYCLSFQTDSTATALRVLFDLGASISEGSIADHYSSDLRSASLDSMGSDVVVYFPSIRLSSEEIAVLEGNN